MSENNSTPSCMVADCERRIVSKGLCHRHYCAARRKGLLSAPGCSIEGCQRAAVSRNLCGMHACRRDRYGDPIIRKKAANGEVNSVPCAADGCDRFGAATHEGVIYCNVHIYRVKTHGDPHTVKKLGNGKSTPEHEKAKAKVRHRRYLATPHGRLRACFNAAKARARAGGCCYETGITKDVFLALDAQTKCGICGREFVPGEARTIDHIIPLARGGANAPANLQMTHPSCNFSKNDKLPDE